jgi:outer membrane immunogenic protein
MKWICGVCLASLAGATAAAADLPGYDAPLPIYSWSGFYSGLDAGYGWGTGDQTAGVGSATFTNPFSTGGGMPGTLAAVNVKGGVFGGHIGSNYQISNWVFGLEISASWTGVQGAKTSTVVFPNGAAPTLTWNSKVNWQATAAPRLGMTWDNWLFYGKAGLAGGGADLSVTQTTGTGGAFSASQQRVGWIAGVGFEYAATQNWVLGLEYDYVDLGTRNYTGYGLTSTGKSRFFSEDVKMNYSEVVGRVSYKFDWIR